MLAATGLRWREDRETIVSSKEFEGSILAEYFSQRATWVAHEVDFQLLYNLCQAPKWKPYAPKENLVIHFRNGDNKFKANETILECAQQFWKTRPRKKKRRGISARLVTIQHYGANEQTGEFFATEESIAQGNAEVTSLIESLQEMKFKVNVQSSQDSDIDFCTLLQADHVCLSEGQAGARWLVGWLVCQLLSSSSSSLLVAVVDVWLVWTGSIQHFGVAIVV